MGTGSQRGIGGAALTAFTVACSTLLLQLVQTRIYSVAYWNHVVYFIISIALLGFGISGTWLSFGENTRLARRLTVPVAAILFGVTTLLSTLVLPQLEVDTASLRTTQLNQFKLYLTYAFAVLPYFFSGWILGKVYRDYAERMGFLYFADLVGAAAGCFMFLGLITPLGAVRLVLIAAALVIFPVAMLYRTSRVMIYGSAVTVVMLVFLNAVQADISSSIQPERTKSLSSSYSPPYVDRDKENFIEFSEWNPISRIDVTASILHPQTRRVFIDGDAWTSMLVNPRLKIEPWDPEKHCLITWASPYLLIPKPRNVLVIGSGGGVDVLNALRSSAERIDAVEINPTTARISQVEYKELTKPIFANPAVHVHTEEGRSFVRRSEIQYDVIVMNAIDTFAALNSGAYVLSESYLYTVDAMKDYVTHLAPGGILNISRWKTPAESVRLFTVIIEALYELGYENPDKHVIAVFNKFNSFVGVMVSNQPFTPEQVAVVTEHARRNELDMWFPVLDEKLEFQAQRTYAKYAELRKSGRQDEAIAEYEFDARPVWDDSPFFFNFLSLRQLTSAKYTASAIQILRGSRASLTLFTLFAFLTVAVLVFMLLPLARRGQVRIPRFRSWLLYFLCLGLSFIFIEIALMQRFALLLGHPARSLALVLATLLLFAGLGSQLRPMIKLPLRTALVLLLVAIMVAAFVYPSIVLAILGWPLWQRGVMTALMIAPLGFFMGMPFPEGIRMVCTHNRDAVPWMWGVNGGATVLGSVMAIMLAMATNFTTVFMLAAAGYAVAALLLGRALREAES